MVAFILAAGNTVAGVPETGSGERLHTADDLWWAGRFDESHDIYVEVANSPNHAVLDRVGALQRLALQSWLQSGKADSALALLNQAKDLGEAKALSYTLMSKFLLDEGVFDSAVSASKIAIAESKEFSDSLQAVVSYGKAVFEHEKEAYLAGKPKDPLTLQDARQSLNAIGHQVPFEACIWELSLGLSLLLNDGPSALQAWRQYLEVAPDDSSFTLPGESTQVLSKVLPSWTGMDLGQETCRALVKALAASRLYGYARLVAAAPGLPYGESLRTDPEVAGIMDYANLIEQAHALINQIYRKRLTADSTVATDIQEFMGLAYGYWQSLEYTGERPEFSTDELGAQLSQRWGAVFCSVDFSPTDFEMTWGHVVREEVRQIEQYGYKAEVRFAIVDRMISNGMVEWATDGDVQIGGWTPTPETVYRIRPAWNKSPIRVWEKIANPKKRKQIENRINNLRAVDDSLAKADPYAYLPGTSLRIWYVGQKRLYDSLASSGHSGEELCRVFMQEYVRLEQESSLFAHEGRHVIDMAYFGDEFETWDSIRVELSAKLSEILFSPDPWFSVGNSAAVFSLPTGKSGHGPASYLMRKGFVDWMDQHADEIAGFDRSRPTLPQMDLLTTAQLLTALRTLDPPARSGE